MLAPASLSLDSYFYSCVQVSLDMTAYFEGDVNPLTLNDLNVEFVVHEDLETSDDLIVTLEVTTEVESKSPLNIKIKVLGRFIASSELREKVNSGQTKHEQVVISGLAILYSSIRDQLLSLTAKMPIGPTFLPTCVFNVQRNQSTTEETLPAPKATTKKTSRSNNKKPV